MVRLHSRNELFSRTSSIHPQRKTSDTLRAVFLVDKGDVYSFVQRIKGQYRQSTRLGEWNQETLDDTMASKIGAKHIPSGAGVFALARVVDSHKIGQNFYFSRNPDCNVLVIQEASRRVFGALAGGAPASVPIEGILNHPEEASGEGADEEYSDEEFDEEESDEEAEE